MRLFQPFLPLHPLQPGAMSGDGAAGSKKQILSSKCLDRWAEFCQANEIAHQWPEDVRPTVVEQWRDALAGEGFGARRINFHLTVLSGVFARARKLGALEVNPCDAVERATVAPTEADLPARPFDEDEVERLALAPYKVAAGITSPTALWRPGMAEEWELLIRLAAVTGQRLGDALALRWDALDLEAGVLDYLPTKTRKRSRRIKFPLQYWPDILRRLRAWSCRHSGKENVFPMLAAAGVPWASRNFTRIIAAAGIDREVLSVPDPGKGHGRRRYACGFHSLRHTANTRFAARGVPADVRAELFGHSTVRMNRIYTHWDTGALDAILRKNDESA